MTDGPGPRTLKDDLFRRLEELSPAERKVARTLLARYPASGLQSATSLAKEAGTSTPTVLRLVTHLGVPSYPEFQRRLQDEVTESLGSPLSRARQYRPGDEQESALGRAVALRARLVERLHETVPPGEFERAVTLLAGRTRGVVLSGGYFSRLVARMLAMQLDQLIPGVSYAEEPLGRDIGSYLGMTRDSVVILLDLRRYEAAAREIAALAKSRGASVIVITDETLSPAAEDADIVLPVAVGGVPFDSFAALVALTESLVDAVFHALGERAVERMTDWENSIRISRSLRGD